MIRCAEWRLGRFRVRLHGPVEGARALVYVTEQSEAAEKLAQCLADRPVALATVEGVDWNDDLSPWPARAVFGGSLTFVAARGIT